MKTIIGCSNSEMEAEKLAKQKGYEFIKSVKRFFPDNEMHIHLDKELGDSSEVFIYQSMYPNPTESLFEVLLVSDFVSEKINNITLIAPWLSYSRQDKRFFDTECFSLKTVSKLLRMAGVKKIITVDVHFHRTPGGFKMHGLDWVSLSAAKLLVNYADNKLGKSLVIGPDEGSSELLELVGGKIAFEKNKNCSSCLLPAQVCKCTTKEKKYEITTNLKKDIVENNIIILDDIIGSGKTILSAIQKLKNKNIFVAATHGFFFNDSLNILRKQGVFVVTTDSIKNEVSNVRINDLLINEI